MLDDLITLNGKKLGFADGWVKQSFYAMGRLHGENSLPVEQQNCHENVKEVREERWSSEYNPLCQV